MWAAKWQKATTVHQPDSNYSGEMPTYSTPIFRFGQRVECAVRGEVVIVGLTDAPVAWPIGKHGRAKSLVVYRDLAKAIKREANQQVCRLFGITPQTVSKWRKALGVEPINPGTRRLLVAHGRSPAGQKAVRAMHRTARDPGRRAKIAAARLGKPRPQSVIEAARGEHRSPAFSGDTGQVERGPQTAGHPAAGRRRCLARGRRQACSQLAAGRSGSQDRPNAACSLSSAVQVEAGRCECKKTSRARKMRTFVVH